MPRGAIPRVAGRQGLPERRSAGRCDGIEGKSQEPRNWAGEQVIGNVVANGKRLVVDREARRLCCVCTKHAGCLTAAVGDGEWRIARRKR